jgi:hypothetical protein
LLFFLAGGVLDLRAEDELIRDGIRLLQPGHRFLSGLPVPQGHKGL